MIILFKYCTDVGNCKSFSGFSFIYIRDIEFQSLLSLD